MNSGNNENKQLLVGEDAVSEASVSSAADEAALSQNSAEFSSTEISAVSEGTVGFSTEQNEDASKTSVPIQNMTAQRVGTSFEERMGDAGYVTGRRYDAVKNAFLSYVYSGKKQKVVRPRITRSGETFTVGRQILGKLVVVGGYIRLFLALDPKNYNTDKYHHKDFSDKRRYAKFPFMIKLSSDRQVKYAEELIDELLTSIGFVKNPDYVVKDQANVFKKPKRKKFAAENTNMPIPPAFADGVAAANAFVSAADTTPPKKGIVTDEQGESLGKIKKYVWFDQNGEQKGQFRQEEKKVFLFDGENKKGFLDKNDNVFSMPGAYVGTVRRSRFPYVLIAVLLLLLVAVTSVVTTYFLTRAKTADYIPVLFVADEKGQSWDETENLPVFFNETFGDTVVAPGMNGTYRFVFQNKNADTLVYALSFSEKNDFGISLRYRLKRDGAYVSGKDGYVGVDALSLDELTIEANSSSVFELEWFWQHNDSVDTEAGQNGASYTLNISLSASVKH